MRPRKLSIFIFSLVAGAILGGALGEIIGLILPAGVAKDFFTKAIAIGFSPHTWDLWFASLTIGFSFKLNFVSILGVLVLSYLLRWF
jgi:hypothetical protein